LGDMDLRLLTPSSPVGIPVAFKPLSGLSNPSHTEPWKRLRAWFPQLLATLGGMVAGTPDHNTLATYFLKLLDDTKANNPSILTVQGLVESIREALTKGDSPLTPEVAQTLMADLTDLAEDLRNAALSYGAPVDLRRLLQTPVTSSGTPGDPARRHVDLVLLSHMSSVADRNSLITALMLEVFAWCRLHGTDSRLLVVVPEVESPAAFIETRPFAQRLTSRVLASSKGTGLLAVLEPASFTDPPGLPRFGAVIVEKGKFDEEEIPIEQVLKDQGMDPSAWGRISMLQPEEWALAAGTDWVKWHRFTPDATATQDRELDTDALNRLLTPDVRDSFSHKPEPEEEGTEAGDEQEATEEAAEAARAARAVEDAEDLLSYTTERKPKRSDSRIHQEVQELLKRKLEEKERAKEAQRFELSEIDLVEGEEPSDLEMAAHTPRPISEGVIDDHRDQPAEPSAQGMKLHSDDLQVELAMLEAKEADADRKDREGLGPDVVVDAEGTGTGWETVTPEIALGAELELELDERPKRTDGVEEEEADEEEEIIVELDEDS